MVDSRRSHRLPVLLLLATGLAAGAACGGSGSGSNDGVASIKTASDKSSGSDSKDKDKDKDKDKSPEDAMLDFTRCMREHGVDMPDPDMSGGGPGVMTFSAKAGDSSGTQLDADTNKFSEANDACKDLLGDVGPMNMSPEQQQEMQDQALAFSKCMREHGVNMPDPTFGGEGQMMMTIGDDNGIDPSDPKFEEAQQACGSAFGPAGAKAGAGLSVGGKIDGAKGGSKGGMVIVGGGAVPAGGGGK